MWRPIRMRRPFSGDRERAATWLEGALAGYGFKVERSAGQVTGTARGMKSDKQKPIMAASRLDVYLERNELRIEAELGRARKTFIFATLFIVGLAGLFLLLQTFLWRDQSFGSILLLFSPWPVILLLLPHIDRKRAVAALRDLAEETAHAGGDASATPGPAPMTPSGARRLALGIVALVGAVGLFIAAMVTTLGGMTRDGRQVVVPGEHVLALDEPGTYTVFHDYRATVNGVHYESDRALEGLAVMLTGPGGGPVPLEPPGSHSRYSRGGRAGYSAYRFQADDAPGTYRLSAAYPPGEDGPETVLSVVHWPRPLRRLVPLWAAAALALLLAIPMLSTARTHRRWNPATVVEE